MPRIRFCKAPWEAFERTDGTHEACVCAYPNLSVNARGVHAHSGERVAGCVAPVDANADGIFNNARRNARRRTHHVCLATRSRLRAGFYKVLRAVTRGALFVADLLS